MFASEQKNGIGISDRVQFDISALYVPSTEAPMVSGGTH
jgi:hypothetical protein